MIRILLVDDQKILLDGLARLLEPYEDLEVVGQLPFSEMVETACGRLKPHVVLMDICMEGKTSGIECTRKIKKHFPQIKVIIMTGFQDVHFVELAQEAGRTVSSTKKVLQTSSWTASTVPWRGSICSRMYRNGPPLDFTTPP